MIAMKIEQLLEDITTIKSTGMLEEFSSRNDLENGSGDSIGDATSRVAGMSSLTGPEIVLSSPIRVAFDEVFCDQEPRRAKFGISMSREVTTAIDFVALVSRRKQSGSASNGSIMGVVLDRPHLPSQFRGGDHVNARMREREDIGRANEQAGDIAFDLLDLLGFQLPIVKQCQPDSRERQLERIANGRIGGPSHDAFDSLRQELAFLVFQPLSDPRYARISECLMSASVFGDELKNQQSGWMLPECVVGKEAGVARQATFDKGAELRLDFGALADKIASMSHEELEVSIGLVPSRLNQAEPIHSGPKDTDQIVVVGFDIAMLYGAIVRGRKWVDESSLEARIPKGAHDHLMVGSGHFDADNGVLYFIFFVCFFKLCNRSLQITMSVLDAGGFEKNSAVKVTEEPLGSRLGTVDTDDAKVLRPNLHDARLNDAGGLAKNSQREGL